MAILCTFVRAITRAVFMQSFDSEGKRNGWWCTRRASADRSIFGRRWRP